MTFFLKSVVPWGRSFDEYVAMFGLSEADLDRSILGCGDGPAGFNAWMHGLGHHVVSCDPLYEHSRDQIECAIHAARDEVMQQVRGNPQNFVWKAIRTPEELEQVRMTAMGKFLADYEAGRREGRYITAVLPALPFHDREYDLCLCSHFLFLYDSRGLDFHLRAIREMARVASEVRIYSVINTNCKKAGFFPDLLSRVRENSLEVHIEPSGYDFWHNGHEMLRITHD